MYNDGSYHPGNQQPNDTTQQVFYPPSNAYPQDPYQSNNNYPYGSYPPPPHQSGSNYHQYGSYPPPPPPIPGQFVYPPQPSSPGPMKPYSKKVFLILAATFFISFLLIFAGNNTASNTASPVGQFGASLFLAVLVSVLIIDWHGFTTLQGWIHWQLVTGKRRFWLGCLYLFLFEFVLVIYFIRTAMVIFSLLPTGVVKTSTRSRISVGFIVGTCVVLIGLFSATTAPAVTSTTSSSQLAQNTVLSSASPTLILTPTRVATKLAVAPISTPAPKPTTVPTALPTQAPAPKPTQAPAPTPQPTQPPAPKPTQAPSPAQPPAQTGVNGNPWGYDFTSGNLIYSPPANFCDYFNCIKSFWTNTNGYVDECNDSTYSHSGGERGACSYHGGEMRPLYSH